MSNIYDLVHENVTTPTTLEQLLELQNRYPPTIAYLPHADEIYDINLNTRKINAPEFLSIQKDHKSKVVYFRVNRYYDHMDLSNTICVIQYITPGDETRVPHIYVVPFFDVMSDFNLEDITETSRDENYIYGDYNPTMIFPWCIGAAATQVSGTLEYAIRFYKIKEETDGELKLVYSLNTLPAKSEILYGMEADDEAMKLEYDQITDSKYLNLIQQFQNSKTYWQVIERQE